MLSSGGCGRTISPCPCAHSTSGSFLFTSHGGRGSIHSLSHDSNLHDGGLFVLPLVCSSRCIGRSIRSHARILTQRGRRSVFLLTHRRFCVGFSSRRERVRSWLPLRNFECKSHSRSGLCACVFHTSSGGMYTSPCRLWPCILSTVVCGCVFPSVHAEILVSLHSRTV